MKTKFLAGVATLALLAGTAGAQDLTFPPGEDDTFNWDSYEAFAAEHDLSGETVTITGPWTGLDAQMVNNVLAYFAAATGATVNYTGSDSFEQDIVISAQAGSPPNLAVFPQPGLASDMASRGFLSPLDEETGDWVRENYAAGDSWVDLGTYAGPDGEEALFGFFYKVDVKSLVWYSPDQFDEAGYDVPTTMEELLALSDQIVADGGTPWCIGLGSGAATGWPATDWVEDMMLRLHAPEVYDGWVDPTSAVRRSARGGGDRALRPVRAQRGLRAGRRAGGGDHRFPRCARRALQLSRRAATCTSRRRSFRPSSRTGRSTASTTTSSTSRPSRRRTLAARCWVRARCSRSPTIPRARAR
jgi:ABC-type glycerol-3-phosphate transport system substrate-binding protein